MLHAAKSDFYLNKKIHCQNVLKGNTRLQIMRISENSTKFGARFVFTCFQVKILRMVINGRYSKFIFSLHIMLHVTLYYTYDPIFVRCCNCSFIVLFNELGISITALKSWHNQKSICSYLYNLDHKNGMYIVLVCVWVKNCNSLAT